MNRTSFAAWMILAILCASISASAQSRAARPIRPSAKVHLDRGRILYGEGRFEEAILEFQTGYGMDPQPDFLYALGQAERRKGDCRKAIEYYRALLKTKPPTEQEQVVQRQVERCESDLASAHPAGPPSPPPAAEVARVLAPPPPVSSEAILTRPPEATSRNALLHLAASGFGDVVSRQGGAEVGASITVARVLDLGAAANIGSLVGARLQLTLHPKRTDDRRLSPLVGLRGVIHPSSQGTILGAGFLVGGAFELGPGRIVSDVVAEFFDAPGNFRSYAVLLMAGYEVDLFRQ